MKFLHFVTFAFLTILTLSILSILLLARTDVVASNWNPLAKLDINADITPVTSVQFRRALANKDACVEALSDAGVDARPLEDFVEQSDPRCGIADRVALHDLGAVKIKAIELNCSAALRLVMWSAHEARPLAREILGHDITRMEHYGSYNCREMRTASGSSGRMSKHATARAVDISGFVLEDGTKISLKNDWSNGDIGVFLKRAHAKACDWFGVVLGPDYNALHADHFHMDTGAWRVCR